MDPFNLNKSRYDAIERVCMWKVSKLRGLTRLCPLHFQEANVSDDSASRVRYSSTRLSLFRICRVLHGILIYHAIPTQPVRKCNSDNTEEIDHHDEQEE